MLTFKPKCCCISVLYLLVLCGCLSVLEEKMCPISHVLCSKQLTTTLASVTTLCPFERWCSACSTRGFLPDWLHSVCSADKDAVSFCEILAPEASYLIDFTVYAVQTKMRCRFVMQAVAASLTDRWSMLSSASTLIPGTCSEQRESCAVTNYHELSMNTNHPV